MDNPGVAWHLRGRCKGAGDMSVSSFKPGPATIRAFRDALGCYGTGVTVVTTLRDGQPLGMTVNSFASVSLDPPLVLWCPAKASVRHAVFAGAPRYAIHVMGENQQALAMHFATSGDKFDAFDWHPGKDGVPHLGGCLARFDCRARDVHDAGDHSIIVGEVLHATHRPGQGLMFKRGAYGGFVGLE